MDLKINLRVEISADEWLDLLFETGCMFIEDRVPDKIQQQAMLEDMTLGFWNWWIEIFILDDERLLKAACSSIFLDENYKELKEGLALFREIEWGDFLNDAPNEYL